MAWKLSLNQLCRECMLAAAALWIAALSIGHAAAPGAAPVWIMPRQAMPLVLYGVPIGTRKAITVEIPFAPEDINAAWLELIVDDLDAPREAVITVNANTELPAAGDIIGDGWGHAGRLPVDIEALVKGRNTFEFSFADNLGGSTGGYYVREACLLLHVPPALAAGTDEPASDTLESERLQSSRSFPLRLAPSDTDVGATLKFAVTSGLETVREAFLEIVFSPATGSDRVKVGVNGRGHVGMSSRAGTTRQRHCVRASVPRHLLKSGVNEVRISLSDDGAGVGEGPRINGAALVLLRERKAPGSVVSGGLVLNCDFTAGSMPLADGTIRDLSGNELHARIRPLHGPVQQRFSGTAEKNVDYRAVQRSGGLADRVSELQFIGRSWIDVPLDKALSGIDGDGTVELILRPFRKVVGETVLLECAGIAQNTSGGSHFSLRYDFGEASAEQRLRSEMRGADGELAHTQRVPENGLPSPGEPALQQVAYCVSGGEATFYQDGVPYSAQSAKGRGAASLFRFAAAGAADTSALRLAIGASPHSNGASGCLLGGIAAVRIYDRPLTREEMRVNYRATVGDDPPSPEALLGFEELADPIEILDDDGRNIGELDADRFYIPFEAQRGDARLGVTRAGHVYVALGKKLCCSRDGGRTWESRDLPDNATGFGILRDDTLILHAGYPKCWLRRSTDFGDTWSEKIPLDLAPFTAGGGGWTQVSQPAGGPALMTLTLRYGGDGKDAAGNVVPPEDIGLHDHLFRSTDSGKSWTDKSLIVRDSAESSVIRLQSGKMLAAIRKQRHPARLLPGDDIEQLKAMDGWRAGKPYIKHGFLAESPDNGYTWTNVRLAPNTADMKHGLCPSDLVQVADGRMVWIYTHRYGPDSGVMARVSGDDGETWSTERYRIRLLRHQEHCVYPTNTVLGDGTILTVCGKNRGNRAMAIRWRLPEQ